MRIPLLFKVVAPAALLIVSTLVHAQAAFPVQLDRVAPNGSCGGLTANRMSVDPANGKVTLEGVSNLGCLPDGAAGLASVSVSIPAGPYTSGTTTTATVQNIPVGATCTARGVTTIAGSGTLGGQGWADGAVLCTSCTGAPITRSLVVNNFSTTTPWRFALQVQCSIQSGGYSILAPNAQSAEASVTPIVAAPGSCPYGDNVVPPDQDGLTIANRQSTSLITNGYQVPPAVTRDATIWTSWMGVYSGNRTMGTAAEGYGFPGRYGGQTYFRMDRGKFIALKFRAPPNASDWWGVGAGQQRYSGPPSDTSSMAFVIAPCPGQFRSAPGAEIGPNCAIDAATKGGLAWMVAQPGHVYAGLAATTCKLVPGQTYYWNIIGAELNNLAAPICSGSSCEYRTSIGSIGVFPEF